MDVEAENVRVYGLAMRTVIGSSRLGAWLSHRSIAVFAAILTLCGCCCIPCLCALINRLITTAITPVDIRYAQMYPLLGNDDNDDNDDNDNNDDDDVPEENVPDLFLISSNVNSDW